MLTDENIISLIDTLKDEKESHTVIPLYVVMNGTAYDLLDMNKIIDYVPTSFRVGFGCYRDYSYRQKFMVPDDVFVQFEVKNVITIDDFKYVVFETYGIEDEDIEKYAKTHRTLSEINEYIELLRNEAYRCYQINRKKRLEEIMKNAE
jgi:hypothetical protein